MHDQAAELSRFSKRAQIAGAISLIALALVCAEELAVNTPDRPTPATHVTTAPHVGAISLQSFFDAEQSRLGTMPATQSGSEIPIR